MQIPKIQYGGITDYNTAKSIARKLFQTYCKSDSLDKKSMERMLIDTYRLMSKQFIPTNDDVNLYSNILDKNADGKVTLEDFQNLAIKFLVGEKPFKKNYSTTIKERLKVAKRLFDKYDKNKNGYLTESQIPNLLIQTYQLMGIIFNPSNQDIKSWILMTDSDGDGRVTLQDYQNLIIKSLQRCGIKIFD